MGSRDLDYRIPGKGPPPFFLEFGLDFGSRDLNLGSGDE